MRGRDKDTASPDEGIKHHVSPADLSLRGSTEKERGTINSEVPGQILQQSPETWTLGSLKSAYHWRDRFPTPPSMTARVPTCTCILCVTRHTTLSLHEPN